MATITTINGSDLPSNSRADINTNFANLNTDKVETSVLDTDTALSANSDSKVATQKATKAYVDALSLSTISGCKLTHSTTQSIGNGTLTTLTWDTESFDIGGYHAGGSPARITIPATGYYLVNSYVRVEDDVLTTLFVQILLDGATVIGCNNASLTVAATGSTLLGNSLSVLYYFTANQYIELQACATTASKNTQTDSYFGIVKLGN